MRCAKVVKSYDLQFHSSKLDKEQPNMLSQLKDCFLEFLLGEFLQERIEDRTIDVVATPNKPSYRVSAA